MEILTLSELHKVCRICLKNDILVSMYSPTFLIRPIEMLEKLQILKLPLDENLPSLLCQSCLYRLLDAYNLQQLAESSERRLREYFGLPFSSAVSSISNLTEEPSISLHSSDVIKPETDCSSVSMYANICDMFDRHDVTNDIVEVVGTDDVELLNDVEIDVSSLTRSDTDDTTLSDVFMSTTKINFDSNMLDKNMEVFKKQEKNELSIAHELDSDKKKNSHKKQNKFFMKLLSKTLKTPDKCMECGKIFHYKGYLEIHKRVHTGEKPYKCQLCSREFITSNKLLVHQRKHSSSEFSTTSSTSKRFQCEICSAFFTKSSNLNSHKFTHADQRKYTCSHCLVPFKSPRDLKRHELTHKTVRDINCTLCEKSFTNRSALNAHMITVHRRIRKHKCTECNKIFGTKSNLINHMRIHSGEKPFECPACSWKFAQSSALKRHMKKHMQKNAKSSADLEAF